MRNLIIVLLLGAAAYAVFLNREKIFGSAATGALPRAFETEIPEYAKKLKDSAQDPVGGKISGKPVLITMKGNEHGGEDRFGDTPCVDGLTERLPADLVPEDPDEVGVLIGLWWEDEVIGSYGGSMMSQALLEYVTVKVVDPKNGALIGRFDVQGGMPPDKVRSAKRDYVGTKADDSVIAAIKEMFSKGRPLTNQEVQDINFKARPRPSADKPAVGTEAQ